MTAILRLSLLIYALFLSALSSADVNISTSLKTTATYYSPGENLPMVLTLKNTGTEGHTVSQIKTDWLSIEVMDIDGKQQKAFTSIAVKAEVNKKPEDTQSTAGTFTETTDLDITDAHLEPGVEITYHIDLKVSEKVLSTLSLQATVEEVKTDTVNVPPGKLDFALTKTSSVSEYTPGESITYTVRLDNKGEIPLLDVTVKDLTSQIQGKDMAGNPIAAFSSIQSITATTDSTASNAGSFSETGPDLDVTGAKVAIDGWISYDIKATVASTLVSPITNSSTANTLGVSETSNELTLNPVAEKIKLDYSVNPTANYKPSQELTYSLKVSNTGGGFALNYSVQNILKTLSIKLANNGDTSTYDHTDIDGHPLTEWTVTVKSVGGNSISSLGQGKVLTNDDLNDTVTIAPGEDIAYEIKATTKPEAISPIHTEASATPKSGISPIIQTLDLTANALTDTITIIKKPVSTQYEPGGWVTYTITATNTDNTKFADNFTIKDQIASCDTVTLADGSSGAPFTTWKLSVDSSEGDGTDPGLFTYGANQTGDINITADFSPAGKVVYKLEAQVNPQATGTILDTGPCPDDNVTEEGGGIEAPQGKAEVLKLVDQQQFVPGSNLTYTITVKNSGEGFLTNLHVYDDIKGVTATGGAGGDEQAFSSWVIKTAVTGSDGSPSTNSNPDLKGTIKDNENIDTLANIYPGDTVTYTIVATTKNDLISTVTNEVTVGDDATSKTAAEPLPYRLTVRKTVDKAYYSQGENTLVYTIRVSSDALGGFAKDILVDDDFQSVTAELLHPAGKMVPAFESFSITTKASEGADPDLNSDYATNGLHAKASLPPAGFVEYQITATIPTRTQDYIVWNTINNKVNVTTSYDVLSNDATTRPKRPDIRVAKDVNKIYYEPNQEVTYLIRVDNDGNGYANDVTVKDDIASLNLFKSWEVSSKADGIGSRVVNPLKANENIDNLVDIAPGGYVEIYVTGIVVNDISTLGKVINTAHFDDPQTGRDFDTSAQIDSNPTTVSFNVTKDGDGIYFTPGKTFTYTIGVSNDSDQDIEHLRLTDNLADIKVKLVNDQGGTHEDIDGTPFSRWRYKINTREWQPWMTDNIVFPDFGMKGHEIGTVTIEADVKDTVVSHKIRNVVMVEHVDMTLGQMITLGTAVYESLRANTGGHVSRKVTPEYYKPGDTVTYTIRASSQTGYYNNISIADEISKVQVTTLDGTSKQAFSDSWTIKVDKVDSHNGGTTDGLTPDTGTAEDNKDLSVVIDVGAGDSVTYTITGVVRDDAMGIIDNGSLITRPYLPQNTYNKTVTQTNYLPGQVLNYSLTVNNTGKVHINDLPVQDFLSAIQTEDVNGDLVPAFTQWTISAVKASIKPDPDTGAKPAYESLYNAGVFSNDKDLDVTADIPIGGSITWKIDAVVNEAAAGDITNTSMINSNTTSVTTHPDVARYKVTKKLTGVFDQSMQPLPDGQYTPEGYISYTLRVEWTSGANIVDLPVVDKLTSIQADWFDGSQGKAFQSWTITTNTDGAHQVSSAGTVENNKDINTLAIVGVNGFVEYLIIAKVSEEAVGDIINQATAGNLSANADVVNMAPADLAITKIAYKTADFKSIKKLYYPGDPVSYRVVLTNNGLGTYYNQQVKDLLSKVKTDIAETAKTAGKKPKGPAYVDWSVSETHTGGTVTNAGGFIGGDKKDINTDIDIAPGGTITFTIDATLADNILRVVTNKVTSGSSSAKAKVWPSLAQPSVKKTILQVGEGAGYIPGTTTYKPGDTVIYEFKVTNAYKNWLNDLKIIDQLSAITTTLSDNSTAAAFASWTVSSKALKSDGSAGLTYIPPVSDNTDINIEVDQAPEEILVFIITAKIKNNAMGVIEGNHVTAGSTFSDTDQLLPTAGHLSFNKTTTYSTTGNIQTYANNGQVKYQLTVSNTGEGFLQGVTIKDMLSTQKSDGGQLVYKSYDITLDTPTPVNSSISGSYQGAVDLDATANIAPGETYTFLVEGTITADVTDSFWNTLEVNNLSTAVTLHPKDVIWISNKKADRSTYAPGDTITFTLTVTNQSVNIGTTTVVDNFSEIKVMTASGTLQPAFTAITASYKITGDTAHSSVKEPILDGSNNLNTEATLAGNLNPKGQSYTSAIFTINATVRDDAVGAIMNIAQVDGGAVPLPSPIEPEAAAISIEKAPTKKLATYEPGETIGFDVTIKNVGKGYTTDIHFEDLLAKITSDVAGSSDKQQVIFAWTTATSAYSTKNSYGIAGKEVNNDKGYFNDYVIAPGDTVSIHLEGQVIDTAMGVVPNRADWKDMITLLSGYAEATYLSAEPDVLLKKDASTDTYQAGKPVTFFVTLENSGIGWAEKITVSDNLALIRTDGVEGTLIPAFQSGTLSVTNDSNPEYVIRQVVDEERGVFFAIVDIPPQTTVTFTLEARVANNAIGDITNVAESKPLKADKTLAPEEGTPELTKTAVFSTYTLGETVGYDVRVTNKGNGSINDLILTDLVSEIRVLSMDGSLMPPFTTWSIKIQESQGTVDVRDSEGTTFTPLIDEDLNVSIDMLKASAVTFRIEGTVMDQAVGDIVNTATQTFNGKTSKAEALIYPASADIHPLKTSDTPTYRPSQILIFTITVENTSKVNIYRKDLVDPLEAVTVILADGTTGPAFVAGTASLTKDTIPSTSSAKKIDKDTWQLSIPPGDTLTFKAQGTVVDNAVGKITNTGTFDSTPFSSNTVPREVPKVTGEFTVVEKYYIPGSPLEYHLKLSNESDFPAFDIALETKFTASTGDYITGGTGNSFDSGTISSETDGGSESNAGEYRDNQDIKTVVSISADGFVKYIIKPLVDINMLTPISVDANYVFALPDTTGESTLSSQLKNAQHLAAPIVPPINGVMTVTKTANEKAYTDDDTQVIYTLTASDPSQANLANRVIQDQLSTMKTSKGKPVFTHWTFEAFKTINKVETRLPDNQQPPPDVDLAFVWSYANFNRNSIRITVTATLGNDIQEDVTNRVQVFDPATGQVDAEAHVTTPINKKSMNEGQLVVTKSAGQPQIKPGGMVEYEVVIDNPQDSVFEDFSLVDKYPAGFRYVDGSSSISYSQGSQFSDPQPFEPQVSSVLIFTPITLQEYQKCRIRYVLKSTLGTPYGNYTNTADAKNDSGVISNKSSVTVSIVGDKLFDTGSIIGKVFIDNNGNGLQSDAMSKNIKVSVNLPTGDYVPQSTVLLLGDHHRSILDGSKPAITQGIKINQLPGIGNRPDAQSRTAKVRFKTTKESHYPLSIKSRSGTVITSMKNGKLQKQLTGDVAKGISTENLQATHAIYKQNTQYIHEITIENNGIQDEGIPGVRLITAEGFKLETDAFGRFHVPDRWILDAKGKNFVIKVDQDSLPAGLKVISENPKVKRITPNQLNRFNFSVQ